MGRGLAIALGAGLALNLAATGALAWHVLSQPPSPDRFELADEVFNPIMQESATAAATKGELEDLADRLEALENRSAETVMQRPADREVLEVAEEARAKAEEAQAKIRNLCIVLSICV